MSNLLFSLLYGACLAVCIGAVEALQYSWPEPEPEPEPQSVEQIIAVPPRPEGVRKIHGEYSTGKDVQGNWHSEKDGFVSIDTMWKGTTDISS